MKPSRNLPQQVTRCGGNHEVAIKRTEDIHQYVDKAVACLQAAKDDKLGSHLRGGNLNQGNDYLMAIIRLAQCAMDELAIDHTEWRR